MILGFRGNLRMNRSKRYSAARRFVNADSENEAYVAHSSASHEHAAAIFGFCEPSGYFIKVASKALTC
jgi:hypothetical protein